MNDDNEIFFFDYFCMVTNSALLLIVKISVYVCVCMMLLSEFLSKYPFINIMTEPKKKKKTKTRKIQD